jgi:hypothetical protein
MGKLIKLKIKPKKDKKVEDFLEQLGYIRVLFLHGDIDNVFIIATGKDGKICTSNGVNIGDAKEMCRDFISDPTKYID